MHIQANLPSAPSTMTREDFSELIRLNHATLLAYARMVTGNADKACDVVQDSFVIAWQNIGRFDVTRDVSAWLRGIVRNKWRESCRRSGREVSMDEQSLALLEQTISTWQADRPEIFDRLADCRSQLPAALADSITAFYDDALDTEQAAGRLHVNGATLRKRLERAREALRECLRKQQQHN